MARHIAQLGRTLHQLIHQPVLGVLLRSRAACIALVLLCFTLAFFAMGGVPLYQCPVHSVTTVPCPGCGLTRSASQTMLGDLSGAMVTHVFGPLSLGVGLVLLAGAVMPDRWRVALAERVVAAESQTGVSGYIFLTLWLYWLLRLVGLAGSLPG